jgi:hypothetical protein
MTTGLERRLALRRPFSLRWTAHPLLLADLRLRHHSKQRLVFRQNPLQMVYVKNQIKSNQIEI